MKRESAIVIAALAGIAVGTTEAHAERSHYSAPLECFVNPQDAPELEEHFFYSPLYGLDNETDEKRQRAYCHYGEYLDKNLHDWWLEKAIEILEELDYKEPALIDMYVILGLVNQETSGLIRITHSPFEKLSDSVAEHKNKAYEAYSRAIELSKQHPERLDRVFYKSHARGLAYAKKQMKRIHR